MLAHTGSHITLPLRSLHRLPQAAHISFLNTGACLQSQKWRSSTTWRYLSNSDVRHVPFKIFLWCELNLRPSRYKKDPHLLCPGSLLVEWAPFESLSLKKDREPASSLTNGALKESLVLFLFYWLVPALLKWCLRIRTFRRVTFGQQLVACRLFLIPTAIKNISNPLSDLLFAGQHQSKVALVTKVSMSSIFFYLSAI